MAEIRQSPSSGGVGLFATRSYQAGDIILHETAPFIRLAPSSIEQEQSLIKILQQQQEPCLSKPAKKDAATTTTLWDCLAPDTKLNISKEMNGKYRGMIQAVLCYVHHLLGADSLRDDNEEPLALDNKKHLDQVTSKLLELYHPHDVSTANPQEIDLLEIADHALQFLRALSSTTPAPAKRTEDDDDNDDNERKAFVASLKALVETQPERLRRIMTIWSCNAFEGGRIYEQASRLNHSCNPTAMFFASSTTHQQPNEGEDSDDDEAQILKALCDIQVGEEITISYLHLPLLYAETRTRQQQLRWTKHLQCACERCLATNTYIKETTDNEHNNPSNVSVTTTSTHQDDVAGAFPCPTCHVRLAQKQLPEDVQYDDDEVDGEGETLVHYIYPPRFHCSHCNTTTAPSNPIITLTHTVVDKVTWYIQELQSKQQRQEARRQQRLNLQLAQPTAEKARDKERDDNDDEEDDEDASDAVLEQHLSLASSMLGARHWTTNLLYLQYLERQLRAMHITQLTQQGQPPEEDQIAECIDALQRIKRFAQGVCLKLHIGHVTCGVTVGVARTLVSLGDVKSQKYAAQWLQDIQNDYVQVFEDENVQKVVKSLSEAWLRHEVDDDNNRHKKRQRS